MDRKVDEKRYQEYLEGKRVIFVGPAPNMIGKELGEWIDSFDVTVRSNGAIFLLDNKDYRKDYGSKCNILYTNQQFAREVKAFNIDDWIMNWKLDFICNKSYKERHNTLYGDKVGIIGLEQVGREVATKVKGALMGPIVLTHLLSYNPADIWFTGFDFYVSKPDVFQPGQYKEYFPGYLPEVITKKADIDNIGILDRHDQYTNTRYIYNLMQTGKVHTNPFIKEAMQKVMSNPDYYSVEGKKKRMNEAGVKIK